MKNAVLMLCAVALLAACAVAPERNTFLEEARSAYTSALQDPAVVKHAPTSLTAARDELAAAERMFNENAAPELVNHHAYMSRQHSAIARETTQLRTAEETIRSASEARQNLVLDAAQADAERAQRQREEAIARAQYAENARQQAAQQARAAEADREQALALAREAELAQQKQAAEQAELTQMLEELQARETERGLVLTLGNVLFDVDGSQLKPGATPTLGKLAQFLREYPERGVLVEGFTDSTGSEHYNRQLSEQRATAVKDALLSLGIEGDRVQVRGYGESLPVATNETAAGRQQNRRVEVVISEEGGVAGRGGTQVEERK